jgi:ABC-type branched-subunit amino acid transport system ATPase component
LLNRGAHYLILDEAFEGLASALVKRFREAVIAIEAMGISLLIAKSNLVSAAAIYRGRRASVPERLLPGS